VTRAAAGAPAAEHPAAQPPAADASPAAVPTPAPAPPAVPPPAVPPPAAPPAPVRPSAAVRRALGPGRDDTADPTLPPPEPPATWRWTERTLRLAGAAAAAAAAALLSGHAWALALAAGPAVLLALAGPGRSRPTVLAARATATPQRCFEGETVSVRIDLAFDGLSGWIDPGVTPGPGVELIDVATDGPVVHLGLTARRWGRWSLGTADVDVHDAGGLQRRTVRVDLGSVDVYPLPEDASLTPIPVRLPDQLGEHTARQRGDGIEFLGVRPYAFGDRQRRIHWPSTTRRGAIQISQFAAERAADTVVLLDALGDVLEPVSGRSSLDDSVRAAAGIARAYLRSHDRIGLVSIGGRTRWLQPGSGGAYLYRIIETVLEVRGDRGFNAPLLDRLPGPALPAGALVYAITPLADDRMIEVLADLAERGNPVVVVEVGTGEPRVEPDDADGGYALRLWRIGRQALRFSLVERGIPVVSWDGVGPLDLALAPLLRSGVRGRR
jgi:uncharacterized protein (DUF58 family)